MSFDVGAIVGRLELRKDQWNQAIKDVKADQKSLSGLVLRNSQQFKQMGRSMTVAGAAIVGSIGLMVKAHATFDHAMNESLAIMGDISKATRKEMAQTALDMSTKSTFAAKELAGAYFFLASAGMDAKQSIKALPVVARFAQAGAFDLATATDLLTDAQTALGLSSKDAVKNQKNLIKVSDILVKANTLANASVQQFSEALTNRAAAALVNVNKSLEEGVAVLAAYADKGVKGQLAGTRLAMMLNALDIAARRNKKAWDENGIALFDAQGEMRSMGNIIGDLERLLSSMSTEQRSATLAALGFNVRTKASILTLMGSSEKIKQWEKDLKDAGGTTDIVAKKQLESLINQFKVLKNQIVEAAISVGKTLGPALKGMIEDVKGVVTKVAEWVKEHPKLTEAIAKSAVAFGGLLTILGPLAMMLPGLVQGLGLLKVAIVALTGPTGLASIAVAGLAGYVAMLGIGIKTVIDETERWEKESRNYVHTAELQSIAMKEMGVDLEKVRVAAGYSEKEFKKLRKEYDNDSVALARAIMKGKEGITLQRALVETSEKRTKTKQEETEAVEKAAVAQKTENELMAEALALYEKWKAPTRAEAFLAGIEEFREGLKIPKLVESPQDLLKDMGIAEAGLFFKYEWEKSMAGAEEASNNWLNNAIGAIDLTKTKSKESGDAQISTLEKVGIASMAALGQSKLGAIAQATMSTYAGAAKTIELLGMPWAIPFVALAILSGLKQVAAIQATGIPSAEKGAYLPSPAIIEAGHGRMGEVVLPLDKAPIDFAKETGDPSSMITQLRLIIQNKITIGEQTFYKESVKSINKAGELRDLVVPNEVVI